MDQLTKEAIQEAVAPLQKQIAALEVEVKKLKSAKAAAPALPKGASFRPLRITREAIVPMVEAHDLDNDGSVSLEEAVKFAQERGAFWPGERFGILIQFSYPEKKAPVAKAAKEGGK